MYSANIGIFFELAIGWKELVGLLKSEHFLYNLVQGR